MCNLTSSIQYSHLQSSRNRTLAGRGLIPYSKVTITKTGSVLTNVITTNSTMLCNVNVKAISGDGWASPMPDWKTPNEML